LHRWLLLLLRQQVQVVTPLWLLLLWLCLLKVSLMHSRVSR
jgi:hypothetical protein